MRLYTRGLLEQVYCIFERLHSFRFWASILEDKRAGRHRCDESTPRVAHLAQKCGTQRKTKKVPAEGNPYQYLANIT
jgi:hypothetical protein